MIITFSNNKGGVGKTTLCVNLALELWKQNKSVCLIDLDAQANVSLMFNKDANYYKNKSILSFLKNQVSLDEILSFDFDKNLAVIHSELNLSNYDLINLDSFMNRNFIELIKYLSHKFEYLFIDTAPNLNHLTKLALLVSDKVIIPYKNDMLSLSGINSIYKLLNQKDFINSNKKRKIFLLSNMNKSKTKVDEAFRKEIISLIQNKENWFLLNDALKNSSLIANYVTLHGLPIALSNSSNRNILEIKKQFNQLIKEIIK